MIFLVAVISQQWVALRANASDDCVDEHVYDVRVCVAILSLLFYHFQGCDYKTSPSRLLESFERRNSIIFSIIDPP